MLVSFRDIVQTKQFFRLNYFLEKATSENNTTEQWDLIIDICDKSAVNSKNSKECIRSIMKRMGHNDPHVAIQAITLLDSCIKNCGKTFHLEIASRDFENEFQRLMTRNSAPVAEKMRVWVIFKIFIEKWFFYLLYSNLFWWNIALSNCSQHCKSNLLF